MNISVVLHDIRSTFNVGSIMRTCDGFGVKKIYIGGYTPYPTVHNDTRLPHIQAKLTKEIAKTALGAESTIEIELYESLEALIADKKEVNSRILALEQSDTSIPLNDYTHDGRDILLVVGREVEGIDPQILGLCDDILEIPMKGQKESFNVSIATGIALYALAI